MTRQEHLDIVWKALNQQDKWYSELQVMIAEAIKRGEDSLIEPFSLLDPTPSALEEDALRRDLFTEYRSLYLYVPAESKDSNELPYWKLYPIKKIS